MTEKVQQINGACMETVEYFKDKVAVFFCIDKAKQVWANSNFEMANSWLLKSTEKSNPPSAVIRCIEAP